MATVINRETAEIQFSVHTPDYPQIDWLINPRDLDDVMNVPVHFRVIEGDTVREATPGEKDAIDATRLPQIKAQQITNYCDRLGAMLQVSAAKPAGELSADADTVAAEFKRVAALVKAANDAAELRSITTTLTWP